MKSLSLIAKQAETGRCLNKIDGERIDHAVAALVNFLDAIVEVLFSGDLFFQLQCILNGISLSDGK